MVGPRRSLRLGVLLAGLFGASAAGGAVVERVVAVVGEHAILLSELRDRARPFLARVEAQTSDPAQLAAARSQLYTQLVGRLVDEELQQRAANRANLTVGPREIEDALERVASQNGVTVERLVEEAAQTGLSEASYRQELRRQLLEAKLLNLRVQGRLRVTEDDVRATYQRIVVEERQKLAFRAEWIRVAIPATLPQPEQAARRALVTRLAARARAGERFQALARSHSTDRATRDRGGDLGWLNPGQLPGPANAAALALDAGGISEPFRLGSDLVVLRVVERAPSTLPGLTEARDELAQRAYMEKMNQARERWLEGLRRQAHVEIRL
ncbi:MAG: peptidylprolyl isomerase [Deltaproteobacteria bacterium]|nr:peptidylprolyl isomerase [Deltaproteobacteria bacterium]